MKDMILELYNFIEKNKENFLREDSNFCIFRKENMHIRIRTTNSLNLDWVEIYDGKKYVTLYENDFDCIRINGSVFRRIETLCKEIKESCTNSKLSSIKNVICSTEQIGDVIQ